MVNWLKCFFLSLFSDRQAKESLRLGIGTILPTCLLAFVFLFLGIFAGETLPFGAFYGGADDFRAFLYYAFIDADRISVEGKDGGAVISANGEEVLINTFADEEDAETYALNGYQLIVDSRNVSSVYDDFTAYCVSSDGIELTYEAYLQLPPQERQNYRFAVRYSGLEKKITEADLALYQSYLTSLADESIQSELNALEERKDALSLEVYKRSVYELYAKAYYPDLYTATGEEIPTLRGYYYGLTRRGEENYFCLFGDMQIMRFSSYFGNVIFCGGIYKEGNGLSIGQNVSREQAEQAVDCFVKSAYYDGASMNFVIELLNCVPSILLAELIIVGVMLLCFGVCQWRKIRLCMTFEKSAKLIGFYAHTAALLSALATMCLGFAVNGAGLSVFAFVFFAGVLVVRTACLLVREYVLHRGDDVTADIGEIR